MRDVKDDLKNAGYSQEEAYFYRLNRELIDKLKKKMRLGKAKKGASKDETHAAAPSIEEQSSKKAA